MWIRYNGEKIYNSPEVRNFKPKERRNLATKDAESLMERQPQWFKISKAPVKAVIEVIKEAPGKIMSTLENKTKKDEKKKDDISIDIGEVKE